MTKSQISRYFVFQYFNPFPNPLPQMRLWFFVGFDLLGHTTRRERLKSALYLRLKKRKVFKTVKGDPSRFLKIQFVAKYQKK